MIETLLQWLIALLTRYQNRESLKLGGAARSSEWTKVRNAFIKENPRCAVCGGQEDCQAHHRKPFHLYPELELEESNLITLCEKAGRNHHLIFGHLGNFQSWNNLVAVDAEIWREKIRNRP